MIFKNNSIRKITWSYSSIILIIFLIFGGINALEYYQSKNSSEQFVSFTKGTIAKLHLLSVMKSELGFDGMIHHFKNYVLRHEEWRLDRVLQVTDRIDGRIAQYVALGVSKAERDALDNIHKVVRNYRNNAALATSMIAQGATPREIDARVKIDDAPARHGLERLARITETGFQVELGLLEKQSMNLRSLFLTGIVFFVVAVIAVTVGSILWAEKGLVRPIEDVARATRAVADQKPIDKIPHVDWSNEIGDMARALGIFDLSMRHIIDLSEQNAAQAGKLRSALETEKSYNQMARQLVAMASHEFRTPLTVIDCSAQRIERRVEGLTHEELVKRAQRIRGAVKQMTTLADDLLSTTALESGDLTAERARCDIAKLLDDCLADLQPTDKHRIELVNNLANSQIYADPKHVRIALANLLGNAVKYSPDGGVIEITGKNLDGNAEIQVRDQGVGIPADQIGNIFTKYFRASSAGNIAGTGIGLAISRRLAKMNGGDITVESVEGEGSVFCLSLPCEAEMPCSLKKAAQKRTDWNTPIPADLFAEDTEISV